MDKKLSKIKVLIVDDDSIARMGVSVKAKWEVEPALRRQIECQFASNGWEALHKVEGESFDLIICDTNMPVMDGLEFLEAFRAGGHSGHFLSLFSGHIDHRDLKPADILAMGADFVCTKDEFLKKTTLIFQRLLRRRTKKRPRNPRHK